MKCEGVKEVKEVGAWIWSVSWALLPVCLVESNAGDGQECPAYGRGGRGKEVEEVKEVKGVKEIRNQRSRELSICLAEGQSVA